MRQSVTIPVKHVILSVSEHLKRFFTPLCSVQNDVGTGSVQNGDRMHSNRGKTHVGSGSRSFVSGNQSLIQTTSAVYTVA